MALPRQVALGDVAVIEREIIDSTAIATGTLYVGLENIESGGRFIGVRPVDAGELASSKFAFTPQHLLYGKLRPYLAKIARPDFVGICSTDILPVLPGPDLDRGYLAWLLLTPQMVTLANSRATGANLPRLSPTALAELRIPLPPLPEQRRIAAILDKADALRAQRRAALAKLDTLTQSIFIDMFGDPATNSKGWSVRAFDETIRDETSRAEKLQRSDYLPEGRYPVVDQGQSVVAGYCNDERYLCPSELPVVLFGDHTRAVKLVRHSFVVGADGAKVLVPKPGVDAMYLSYLLRELPIPDLGYSRHMREVKRLVFPIPPSARQREFAQRVTSIEVHRKAHDRARLALDALFAALQHRAFRGEL